MEMYKTIVIYPGRFQPFGIHHFENYKRLCTEFGVNNVFVCTSNHTNENSPMDFIDKRRVIEKYGIQNIFQVKSPYCATEITSFFDPEKTVVVYAVGQKDSERLNTFKPYKHSGFHAPCSTDIYYKYLLPHVSKQVNGQEISGTVLRQLLPNANQTEFKQMMGWYDITFQQMFQRLFTESIEMKLENVLTEGERITKTQLLRIEQYIDKFFKHLNIDIDFQNIYKGTHFFDRLNDPRNPTPITADELRKIFKKVSIKHGYALSKTNPNAEGVLKDLESDLNIPFMLVWDKENQEIDLRPKTIMKKPDFKTSSKVYSVESFTQMFEGVFKNGSKSKHIQHLYEDTSLTFSDLIEIFTTIIRGKIDLIEKVDGQNFKVTFKNGQVLASRNKGQILNPLAIQQTSDMFAGRGDLQKSFVEAHKDVSNALKGLPPHILSKLEENRLWVDIEVLNPKTRNIFDYGIQPLIMIHGLTKYDELGNEVGRIENGSDAIYNVLKRGNLLNQTTYNIINQNKLKVNPQQTIKLLELINSKMSGVNLSDTINLVNSEELIGQISCAILNSLQTPLATLPVYNLQIADLSPTEQIKYATNMIKLQSVCKSQPNSYEGIVFVYNGKLYKMTGGFRYFNQILGIKRYKR